MLALAVLIEDFEMPGVSTRCVVLFAVLVGGCLSMAVADEKTETETRIIPVQSRSARDLSQAVEANLHAEGVQVTVDRIANVLVVKGPKDKVEQAVELVKTLDPTPAIINIVVEINTSSEGDKTDVKLLDRLELSSLDNQMATVEFGQQIPVVTGQVSNRSGGTINQMERQTVGTMLEATGRASADAIILSIALNKSWVDSTSTNPGASKDDIVVPSVLNLNLKTALRLEPGKSQTIKCNVSGGAVVTSAEITISASLGPNAEASKTTGAASAQRTSRSRSGARTAEERAQSAAELLFNRIDSDGDGKVDTRERAVVTDLLNLLGFKSSEDVTVSNIARLQAKKRAMATRRQDTASKTDVETKRTAAASAQRTSRSRSGARTIEERAQSTARVFIRQMDSDGDGEVDSTERAAASRVLTALGLKSSEDVTVSNLAKLLAKKSGFAKGVSRAASKAEVGTKTPSAATTERIERSRPAAGTNEERALERAKSGAEKFFSQMDSNGDGEVDSDERADSSRVLDSLGMKSSEDVTVSAIAKLLREKSAKAWQRRQAASKTQAEE